MKKVVNIEKVKQRIAELKGAHRWLKSDYEYAINNMMPAWTHYYGELYKKAEVIERFYSMIVDRFDRIEKFVCFREDEYYMEVPAAPETMELLEAINDRGIPGIIVDVDGKEVIKFINGDTCNATVTELGTNYFYIHTNIVTKLKASSYCDSIADLVKSLRQSVRFKETSGTPVISETIEFNSPINREYSAIPTMDCLSENTRSTIEVSINSDDSGWFEWDVEELGLTESGCLDFRGNILVGYDGVFELPKQLLNFLDTKGFITIECR